MLRNSVTRKELLACICRYEGEVCNSSFVTIIDENGIYRFKGPRNDKLVIIFLARTFSEMQVRLIAQAREKVLGDINLSDSIEVFSAGAITDELEEELAMPLKSEGISLLFYDSEKLKNLRQFDELLEGPSSVKKDEIDPSFFDYLAMSNDSSDIKNGFFYSLLLMELFHQGSVTEAFFIKMCSEKYSREESDVKRALKELRKEERITGLQKGGLFSLSCDERRKIESAIRESREEEGAFIDSFNQIVDRYGIKDKDGLLECLKKRYLSKYIVSSKFEESENDQERKADHSRCSLADFLKDMEESQRGKLFDELKTLCGRSGYLDQYGLIHSFLNLFRSKQYEGYLAHKEYCVYLDTPLVVDFICAMSTYRKDEKVEWEDDEFTSAEDLFSFCSKNRIIFYVPYDYLVEAMGEFKKALQFDVFCRFPSLPIPAETANVFYNFYLQVRRERETQDSSEVFFSFDLFAKQLGFKITRFDDPNFDVENMGNLRFLLDRLGCKTLGKIDTRALPFSIKEEVEESYSVLLADKNKNKSLSAIRSDVRQAIHLADRVKNGADAEQEFYLVSWDNSLYDLRNEVCKRMGLVGHKYYIFRPRELAQKLAFRRFAINKESVSNEVFTYASNTFKVKEKIRSLFDNILNPFFASYDKSNAVFVQEVLKMQQACLESEERDSPRSDKTALENIFVSIISELPKQQCTLNNLKEFLNDEKNNDAVIPVFKKAFADYKATGNYEIAKQVCEMVKKYVRVSGVDGEVKLS